VERAKQALLPFVRPAPRTARSRTASSLGAAGSRSLLDRVLVPTAPLSRTRIALAAVPLRHHAIQRVAEQLEIAFPASHPAVYVHEGARQSLERRLAMHAKQAVLLSITDNRHSMIHATRRSGLLRVRLHHMFLDASPPVVDALAKFLLFRDRDASAIVGVFIDTNTGRIRPRDPARTPLRTEGEIHDLRDIYAEVNDVYFGGEVDARICWGAEATGGRGERSTIKLGSYTAQERLIRVHPRLDQSFVPRYFVGFVVYHEMLHHVLPATRANGRRMLHTPEFRLRERGFRHYARAVSWEKSHLDRLLK
jgi:hypothetical protein